MAKTRIFGTPSEPLFNNCFGLPPALLEDSLHVLAEDNEKNMEIANEKQGYFKNGKTAGKTFLSKKRAVLAFTKNSNFFKRKLTADLIFFLFV